MMDAYTKIVLTVIAVSLAVLAGREIPRPASAQIGQDCGHVIYRPCYIELTR